MNILIFCPVSLLYFSLLLFLLCPSSTKNLSPPRARDSHYTIVPVRKGEITKGDNTELFIISLREREEREESEEAKEREREDTEKESFSFLKKIEGMEEQVLVVEHERKVENVPRSSQKGANFVLHSRSLASVISLQSFTTATGRDGMNSL